MRMSFNLDSPEFNPDQPAAVPAEALVAAPTLISLAATGAAIPTEVLPYVHALGQHGGVYRLLDPTFTHAVVARVQQRLGHLPQPQTLASQAPGLTPQAAAHTMSEKAQVFFKHLVKGKPYLIHSALISHLTLPGDGRAYSAPGFANDNYQVPAFMTFVGQFIDHDLTLNPFNLFQGQAGEHQVANAASALLDLDSVYNRDPGNALAHGSLAKVFDTNPASPTYGHFQLRKIGPNAYDLTRETDPHNPLFNKPFIYDLRNDENQMILQVHILLMRVHNELVAQLTPAEQAAFATVEALIDHVRSEVLFNWQRFLLHDYLPTVVSHKALKWVADEIRKPDYGQLRHQPEADGTVRMPHEFAISFRMGHTQLRDGYQVQPGGAHIPLFNNRSVEPGTDLRGGIPLPASHVIDWPFFSDRGVVSNKIDSHVTNVVFDLPESAIPDKVKLVGNLPQRNLIRSAQVHLAAAEDLLTKYAIAPDERLTPEQIEPDPERRKLFQLDNKGNYAAANRFRTPLWYYVIKEAELCTQGRQLGPLGGRIIAEVIAGGIYYQPKVEWSVVKNPAWQSKITGGQLVRFEDLVDFVTKPTPPAPLPAPAAMAAAH